MLRSCVKHVCGNFRHTDIPALIAFKIYSLCCRNRIKESSREDRAGSGECEMCAQDSRDLPLSANLHIDEVYQPSQVCFVPDW
jgi:hypothetical protein